MRLILSLLLVLMLSPTLVRAQWVRMSGVEKQVILSFAANESFLFSGSHGGIYDPTGDTKIGGVFRSTDNGTTWIAIDSGLVNGIVLPSVNCIAVCGTNILIGTSEDIYISTDNGTSWRPTTFGIMHGNVPVQCLFVSGSNIFAGSDGAGVFLSTDNGANWISRSSGLTNPLSDKRVYALGGLDSILYAGTWNGGVFLSTNNGESWTHSEASGNWQVTSLAVIDTTLFAGMWAGSVFRTTDNGATWTRVDSGLTNPINHYDYDIQSLAVRGPIIFAGTALYGVYLSTNMGRSWLPVNDGLEIYPGSTFINVLTVIGEYIYAGTATGIWRRSLSEITSVKYGPAIDLDAFDLVQNYPNPFNPTTIINYRLLSNGFVSLKVYNVLGQQVSILVQERQTMGTHTIIFNASMLPSGVYFCRLAANGRIVTKKMELIR